MGIWQKLFGTLKNWPPPEEVEAESRSWMVQCPCGEEASYWELGGMRYKASSRGKRLLRRCAKCGRFRWHRVYKKEVNQPQESKT